MRTHSLFILSLLLIGVAVAHGQVQPADEWGQCVSQIPDRKTVRVSQDVARSFIKVKGEYEDPNLAHDAPNIKGDVKLHVMIDRTGKVACIETVGVNYPMLVPGAIEVAKRSRFGSYLIRGEAVVVDTMLTVHGSKGRFKLTW